MANPDNPRETPARAGFADESGAILDAMLSRAAFDGWTERALSAAARDAGVDRAARAAAYPAGVTDVLRAWSSRLDEDMAASMSGPAFGALKIREKVAFAVRTRLDLLKPHREAARRSAATLALPVYGALGVKLGWKTADAIWRGLGDASTDFNFYSKRTILSGVWISTFMRWLADESEDQSETNAFLDARIENVMQIEKGKAKLRKLEIDPAKPIGWLAKIRYPASS